MYPRTSKFHYDCNYSFWKRYKLHYFCTAPRINASFIKEITSGQEKESLSFTDPKVSLPKLIHVPYKFNPRLIALSSIILEQQQRWLKIIFWDMTLRFWANILHWNFKGTCYLHLQSGIMRKNILKRERVVSSKTLLPIQQSRRHYILDAVIL